MGCFPQSHSDFSLLCSTTCYTPSLFVFIKFHPRFPLVRFIEFSTDSLPEKKRARSIKRGSGERCVKTNAHTEAGGLAGER